jgi:hypothetical protein
LKFIDKKSFYGKYEKEVEKKSGIDRRSFIQKQHWQQGTGNKPISSCSRERKEKLSLLFQPS